MKKTIRFSKGFIPCAILSVLIIALGVVGFVTKGINLGLDFKPGLIEDVRIANPAVSVVYDGNARATLELSRDGVSVIVSGTGAENKTSTFMYAEYKTVQDVADALNTVEGVNATVNENGDVEAFYMFLNSAISTQLTHTPLYIYAKNSAVSVDDVRAALEDMRGISVKALGSGAEMSFQIRMPVNSAEDSSRVLQGAVEDTLAEKFGENCIAVVKTDFIGSSFSKTLASKSIILLLCTIVLIWVYAAFRFHWDFALGSVIALLHDTCIMFTFIVWTQMEFTTTVLAAVLTIIGYSINATVVILDRVRFIVAKFKDGNDSYEGVKITKFKQVLDIALSDTLGRSIITTLTTLFAVISLYIFTTGSIKDFALALIVGLISGCYSSIFISSGFISLFRKTWVPKFGVHHSEKSIKAGALDLN